MSKRRKKKEESKPAGTITTFLISEEEKEEKRSIEEKKTITSPEDLESIVNTIFSLIKAKGRISKTELMMYCKSKNIKPQHMYKAVETLINRKLVNRRIINDELHYEVIDSSHR